MKYLKTLTLLPVIALLGACQMLPAGLMGQGSGSHNGMATSRDGNHVETQSTYWDVRTSAPLTARQMEQGLFRMVVVRPQDNMPASTAANIYIDGDYRASLLPNAFTELVTCAGNNVLMASVGDVKRRYEDKRNASQQFASRPGETRYFVARVDTSRNAQLTELTPDQAQPMLQGVPRQSHTVQRMRNPTCQVQMAAS